MQGGSASLTAPTASRCPPAHLHRGKRQRRPSPNCPSLKEQDQKQDIQKYKKFLYFVALKKKNQRTLKGAKGKCKGRTSRSGNHDYRFLIHIKCSRSQGQHNFTRRRTDTLPHPPAASLASEQSRAGDNFRVFLKPDPARPRHPSRGLTLPQQSPSRRAGGERKLRLPPPELNHWSVLASLPALPAPSFSPPPISEAFSQPPPRPASQLHAPLLLSIKHDFLF